MKIVRTLKRVKQALKKRQCKRSGKAFHEYYVEQTTRLLKKGVAHPTLGHHGKGKHL